MKVTDWAGLNNKLEKTFKFNNYNEVAISYNIVMQIAQRRKSEKQFT